MHYGEATSAWKPIWAGVLQGKVLGPHLYLMYTAYVPKLANTTAATFPDDTAIVSGHQNYESAVAYLRTATD